VVSARPEVTLRRARPEEAGLLAEISQRAFHSDHAVGGPVAGGPPGYNSADWQKEAMGWGEYHSIVVGGEIAGGAIVVRKGPGHLELCRLFLDPTLHRRGIGRRVMALLWEIHPEAGRWTLDTPAWNRRTRPFYESLGFVEASRVTHPGGPELVVYERRAPAS
jgi:ribosomal protein S18 acetylase RimI-like enzyme